MVSRSNHGSMRLSLIRYVSGILGNFGSFIIVSLVGSRREAFLEKAFFVDLCIISIHL